MPQLDLKDMRVLKHYAEQGMRERYWNYLASEPGNDQYGLLALGVVRNDSMPGKIANAYAQEYMRKNPVKGGQPYLDERGWDKVGRDLILADYEMRRQHFNSGRPDLALNLPVSQVYYSHVEAFAKNHISQFAWTPALLIEASHTRTGNMQEAEQIWHEMLDSKNLGVSRASDSLGHQWDNDKYFDRYTWYQTKAYATAVVSRPYDNPSVIQHHTRDSQTNEYEHTAHGWSKLVGTQGGIIRQAVTDPVLIHTLDDISTFRSENMKLGDFDHPNRHKEDLYKEIKGSKWTIAANDLDQPTQRVTQAAPEPEDKAHSPRRERFEQLFAATMAGDEVTARGIQSSILQSDVGQQMITQAKETVNQQEQQQAEAMVQAQQAQQVQEAATQVQRGPVMRL
jgi:hypothetical protein